MAALLEALPETRWPELCVHVAGSEGKTSTCQHLADALTAAGLRTGLYTSPHLRDVRERLRVDGAFLDEPTLSETVGAVRAAADGLERPPSWFEFLTAVARAAFVPPRVDAAVWETGLGGRLDATRLLRAHACVITSVSLEHTAILGDSLAAIAREKAGILRPGVPVILSAALPAEARHVLMDAAEAVSCEVVVADDIDTDLPGRSAALARAVVTRLVKDGRLSPPGPAVEAALQGTVAGRLQRIGRVLFDGAHTAASTALLAAHLEGSAPVGALVFGTTTGRDGAALLSPLLPLCRHVVLTRPPGERGSDPSALAAGLDRADVHVEPDPAAALALARDLARKQAPDPAGRQAGEQDVVLVTGSLHLVGHLLPDEAVIG
jgi:dihydrofolate synthase/folylpolyglutamate synthase